MHLNYKMIKRSISTDKKYFHLATFKNIYILYMLNWWQQMIISCSACWSNHCPDNCLDSVHATVPKTFRKDSASYNLGPQFRLLLQLYKLLTQQLSIWKQFVTSNSSEFIRFPWYTATLTRCWQLWKNCHFDGRLGTKTYCYNISQLPNRKHDAK